MTEDIEDLVQDEEKAEELSEIIEKKVEEKVESLKEENKTESKSRNEEVSRRSFLKKLGLGVAGLGAASLVPGASAYDVKSSDGLEVFQGGTEYLDVSSSAVNVINTVLQEKGSRVATRNWVDSDYNNYADTDAVTAIENAGTISTNISGDADTVDGDHASAFANASHNHDGRYYTESESDSNFAASGHAHALGDLSNVTATGEGSGNGLNADTVDGSHATDLGGVEDHSNLTGVTASQHHARPTSTQSESIAQGWQDNYQTNMEKLQPATEGSTGTWTVSSENLTTNITDGINVWGRCLDNSGGPVELELSNLRIVDIDGNTQTIGSGVYMTVYTSAESDTSKRYSTNYSQKTVEEVKTDYEVLQSNGGSYDTVYWGDAYGHVVGLPSHSHTI